MSKNLTKRQTWLVLLGLGALFVIIGALAGGETEQETTQPATQDPQPQETQQEEALEEATDLTGQ